MKLGVDIGNSGIKVARLDTSDWNDTAPSVQRIDWLHEPPSKNNSSAEIDRHVSADAPQRLHRPGADTWLAELEDLCQQWGVSDDATWLLSSVRQDASKVLEDWLASSKRGLLRQVQYRDIPLVCDVDFPEQVGIDRLLAAYAASRRTNHRPLIVIQAGSAVTVDLVNSKAGDDAFCGGAILPGVPMMLRLLGQGAEKLPSIVTGDFASLPPLPGRNTQSAMICGATSALVGGINHLVDRYRSCFGGETQVFVSGGDGPLLSSHIQQPVAVGQQLVLAGLARLSEDI